jgi:thymidylate synthase (FAD)
MKIIKAYYEILNPIIGLEMLKSIERAGRTCYKSEGKITPDSAEEFVKMLIKRGHESVLEHQTISVLFVCDRGVSHEIVRNRIASFSQESTRYCNYSKENFGKEITFIAPLWIRQERIDFVNDKGFSSGLGLLSKDRMESFYHPDEQFYFAALHHSEQAYFNLINQGWEPQKARSVLPNSLKTEIVVTANLREWRTIFRKRTSQKAHSQMRELMCPLLSELQSKIPIIFDDIQP